MFKSLSSIQNIFALVAVSIGFGYLLAKEILSKNLIKSPFELLVLGCGFILFVVFSILASYFLKPVNENKQIDFGGAENEQEVKTTGEIKTSQSSWFSKKSKQKIEIDKK